MTKLSASLLEESKAKATIRAFNVAEYARWSINCLKAATDLGFRANHTQLCYGDAQVAIPRLVSPRGELLSERLQVPMTEDQRQELYDYAGRAGTSDSERVRRSLRFGNFIVEHVGMEYPVFEHNDTLIQFVG